jgi:hypothetical protein
MSDSRTHNGVARLAGHWDASVQHQVAAINLQFLQLLSGQANPAGGEACGLRTPLVPALRSEWRRLSHQALQRLATCPYLLIDAAFAVPARWRELLLGAVQDADPEPPGQPDPASVELVRRTMVLAWHLARSNPLAARIALGMCGECTALIAARNLHQLEAVASKRPLWVRPRWEDQVEVWRQLLRAAADDHAERLRLLQLRGVQLMAGGTVERAMEQPARQ